MRNIGPILFYKRAGTTVFLPLTDTDRSNGPSARHLTDVRSALEDFMTELNGAPDSRRDDRSILGNWLTDCQPCISPTACCGSARRDLFACFVFNVFAVRWLSLAMAMDSTMWSRCSVTAGTVVADVSISSSRNVGNKRNRDPKTSSVGEKFVVALTQLFICVST